MRRPSKAHTRNSHSKQLQETGKADRSFAHRAELGRATWKYFHTVMARFPEHPTTEQQEALRSFIHLFARLYPWYDGSPVLRATMIPY